MGLRSSRWMFSMRAIWAWVTVSMSRMRAGMVVRPASLAARRRRSPAMSWYCWPTLRTRIGWIRPVDLMEAARSAREDSSNERRGWWGLGWIWERRSSVGEAGWGGVEVGEWGVGDGDALVGISASTGRSEMEMRLLRPRPSLGLFFC